MIVTLASIRVAHDLVAQQWRLARRLQRAVTQMTRSSLIRSVDGTNGYNGTYVLWVSCMYELQELILKLVDIALKTPDSRITKGTEALPGDETGDVLHERQVLLSPAAALDAK